MLRENSKLNTIESPINRGFSYEKEGTEIEREKPYWHFAKIESSLNPKEHPYSLKIKLIPTSSNQSS